ncbi:hypothetical protein Amet_0884 [Alkaliphilus metalliredigens QYMF]|uniref:Uncharacterized protein n=1 Tax=Alkaliphilus metalliredigens (strain QYMF) TaxID=293826 RepID=A6TLN8_ALKMQ|nr:hypothetical protein Amet_0884 [Alkaliphilus metalliredigens QYMF]
MEAINKNGLKSVLRTWSDEETKGLKYSKPKVKPTCALNMRARGITVTKRYLGIT